MSFKWLCFVNLTWVGYEIGSESLRFKGLICRRMWAKREEQLKGVFDSSVGLYGDLQGIVGRAMSEIEALGPPMIESKSTSPVK